MIHFYRIITFLERHSVSRRTWKMEIYMLISVLSVMYSWILCTVLSAPTEETPATSTATPGRHVRTKRCSCANFLDKECVYFCHLDIIWVNTPERVVSYGLGSETRTRRAVADSMVTSSGPRCQCLRLNDDTCRKFCRLEEHLRYEAVPDSVIRSAEGDARLEAQRKHKLAPDTGRIKRTKNSIKKQELPLAVGAVLKTQLLFKKWSARRHHRARAWESESAAS